MPTTHGRRRLGLASLLTAMVAILLAGPGFAGDVTVQLGPNDGFVVEDNTGTIERLRVDEATGNISRNGALFVHTTGTDNTFVGEGAGDLSTTGQGLNSAFGYNALDSIATGASNSAFGWSALFSNTEGNSNSAFGRWALREGQQVVAP